MPRGFPPSPRATRTRLAEEGAAEEGAAGKERWDVVDLLGFGGYRRLRDVLAREESFDLDAYRASYLARRLRARLGATGATAAEYVARVERDAVERRALMEVLGVNVTSFFRDPTVWTFLEEVALPPLLATRAATVRAASLACAGGHEAYSVAMLLAELARGGRLPVRVDAFDVDPQALAAAARGKYSVAEIAPLSEAALERYFDPAPDGGFQVGPELKRIVRVERRDIMTEPLPTGYDLVLCRNMMIYVEGQAKDRLLRKMHDSLAEDGLLVLGQSEVALGRSAHLFRALSPRHRVYVKAGRP